MLHPPFPSLIDRSLLKSLLSDGVRKQGRLLEISTLVDGHKHRSIRGTATHRVCIRMRHCLLTALRLGVNGSINVNKFIAGAVVCSQVVSRYDCDLK